MNQNSEKQLTPPDDDELLTAYLDGELADEQRIAVETRLSQDKQFRGNLHQLQRTWDMLDELPQALLKNSFTQSTLEMVVADAQRATRGKRSKAWDWPLRIAVFVGLPSLACFASLFAIHYWQDTPNRIMINHLPVIDNVDVYLKAEDIEFLTQLRDTGLFDENDEFSDETLD